MSHCLSLGHGVGAIYQMQSVTKAPCPGIQVLLVLGLIENRTTGTSPRSPRVCLLSLTWEVVMPPQPQPAVTQLLENLTGSRYRGVSFKVQGT